MADRGAVALSDPRKHRRQVGLPGADSGGKKEDPRPELGSALRPSGGHIPLRPGRPGCLYRGAGTSARRCDGQRAPGRRLPDTRSSGRLSPGGQIVAPQEVGGRVGPRAQQHAPRLDSSMSSRRGFLKAGTAGVLAGGLAARLPSGAAFAAEGAEPPEDSGAPERRILIKGGIVLSLDPTVGDFESADVLIEGKRILEIGPNLQASADVIDARGMIVMPGFITTHNHQYECLQRTIIALRCSKLSGRFEDFWERRSRKVEEKVTVRTV